MNIRKSLFFCSICVLLLAGSAFAQTGKLGIGAHGTIYPSVVEDGSEDEERSFAFGLHARARLTATLGIEASVEFREDEVTDDLTLKLYPIQFSVLYYLLPNSKLSIYGLAGIGWTRTSIEGNPFGEDATDGARTLHFGAGLEVPVNRSFGLYGDIRYLDVDLDLGGIFAGDLDSSGWQSNFGISFYF